MITPAEFNPYEGETIEVNIPQNDGTSKNYREKVESNPGFAPYLGEGKGINGYVYPSGLFNNNYSKYNSTYNEYYHDGVDFPATRATPIHSFIFGEIKDCYTSGNGKDGKNGGTGYGNMLFIENFQKNKVYVLCHIPKTDLQNGTKIYPGMIIAKVGNIGNSTGPHLHLTVIDCSWDVLAPKPLSKFSYDSFRNNRAKRINPFCHTKKWILPT